MVSMSPNTLSSAGIRSHTYDLCTSDLLINLLCMRQLFAAAVRPAHSGPKRGALSCSISIAGHIKCFVRMPVNLSPQGPIVVCLFLNYVIEEPDCLLKPEVFPRRSFTSR